MRKKITIELDEEDLKRLDTYREPDPDGLSREEVVLNLVRWYLNGMDGFNGLATRDPIN